MKTARSANRDSALKMWVRALERTAAIAARPELTLPASIHDLADKFEAAPAFLSTGGAVSYRELAERCDRYTRWAKSQRLGKGDVICLLMTNCPEYMAIWLGLCRLGVVVALVNTNLRGAALAHSINIVTCKHIIVGEELTDAFVAALPHIERTMQCWTDGANRHGFPRIDCAVRSLAGDRIDNAEFDAPSIADQALYIYTSGTTGLPKAARVSHLRLLHWSHWFAGMMDTQPGDRMYNCLPMYHSIGGVVATGALLVNGGSVVVRRQFSASRFWEEIAHWDCTLFQYIGELCRYLVNSPPHPCEVNHRLRLCCGNGLRLDTWTRFQTRFRIPQILEFYAATEGNFSLYNCDGKPGAIGRIPAFLAHRFPVALIKLHASSEEPLRDDKGYCQRCDVNEAGEAIGKIAGDRSDLGQRFEGYTSREATDKKILRDVFASGDRWFRTGDLMYKDDKGFFYFVDRIGDTFRWKGENVSTAEVAEAIAACPEVADAIVYGVTVANAEGRAGMATIRVTGDFDLLAFRQHLVEHLPDYARPRFLRICETIETTGTFKPQKQALLREAYDPALVADPLYFDDQSAEKFVPLDAALHALIERGELRL